MGNRSPTGGSCDGERPSRGRSGRGWSAGSIRAGVALTRGAAGCWRNGGTTVSRERGNAPTIVHCKKNSSKVKIETKLFSPRPG